MVITTKNVLNPVCDRTAGTYLAALRVKMAVSKQNTA
jgi:hypothetical protein